MNETPIRAYVGVLLALALASVASWTHLQGFEFGPRVAFGALVFAVFIFLGDAFPIRVSDRNVIGVWDVGLLVGVALLGPTWTALAALPSAFYVGRRDWLRTVYEVGHVTTLIYLAGAVFSLLSEPLLTSSEAPTTGALYGIFVAGMALQVANKAIVAVLHKVKNGRPVYETWKEDMEPYLLSDAVNVTTAGLGLLAFAEYGPVAAMAAVAGAVGSQVLVYRSRDRAKELATLRERVSSLEEALANSNVTFGAMIVRDLGRKDGFTHRHAAATAVYAAGLAREMGLDEARAGRLRMAGLLHNVGMFGLPEELLTTTGKLNSIAQHRLAEHPARGEEALAGVPEFGEMASWVRWHHERPDGRGYPDKLRGPWIPQEAKILAVSQAYAALVLDGPARPGVDHTEARKRLSAGVETEFDGVVVRAFLRILDTESEGYRMADDHRFVFPDPGERRRRRPDAPGREEGGALSLPR